MFSSGPRFDGAFEPQRLPELDELATAVFRFDGDLRAETHGGVELSAVAGPVR